MNFFTALSGAVVRTTILLFALAVFGCDQPRSDPQQAQSDSADATPKVGPKVSPKVVVESPEIAYPATNPDNYQPKADWKLVWSDEFDGKELDLENWTRQILPDAYNDEWQQYFDREENAYVEDGHLVIKAIHTGETHGDKQYTSGRIHTGGNQQWTYGRIAARIQLPHGQGIWPAFWMLGSNITEIGGDTPWPQCGEIDILELWGSRDDGAVEANIHFDDEGHKMLGAKAFKLDKGVFADQFHVFEIEWNKEKITWYVDGKSYCEAEITAESMAEFHKPFYILLNIAVGGEYAGRPDETTPFPALMYVDWVRVYELN